MAARRENFTDRQRAEIYVLDRALCSFSGKSLWLLDYGASPSSVDWADHIGPAAKGGTSDITNGACASFLYNWAKRDRPNAIFLFHRGAPTMEFFVHYETVPLKLRLICAASQRCTGRTGTSIAPSFTSLSQQVSRANAEVTVSGSSETEAIVSWPPE